LELDIDRRATGHLVEDLAEQRDLRLAVIARDRALAVDIDAHRKLSLDAKLRQLVPGDVPHVALVAGQPTEVPVMKDDGLLVFCQLDVELDGWNSELHCATKTSERIF